MRYNLRSSRKSYRHQAAQYLAAQEFFGAQHNLCHIFDEKGNKQSLKKLLQGDNKTRWNQALSNEWGRVANGNMSGIKGTNTLKFISKRDVPSTKAVTYGSFVCDHHPLKTEKWRVRLVVGGDKLEYVSDAGSPTTNFLDTKIILNSVISDKKMELNFSVII